MIENRLNKKQINQENKKFRIIIGFLLSAVIILFFYYLGIKHNQNTINKKLYFVDSKYKNIKSEFDKQSSNYFVSIIEKPVTKNNFINNIIDKKVKQKTNFFFQQSKKRKDKKLKTKQNISYQITLNNDYFLSLVVFIEQDLIGSHPTSETLFWTFDKKQNKLLTVSDLFNHNQEQINLFMTELHKKIIEANKNKKSVISSEELKPITDPKKLHFIVKNDHIISFPFGRGMVGPQSIGTINIDIDFSGYSRILDKSSIAHKIFKIKLAEKALVKINKAPTPTQKNIALTFDDGPGPHTEKLLLILKKHQAKATFFVLGSQVNRYKETLKKIDQDGHEIGNHTFGHPSLTKLNENQITDQLQKTNNAIQAVLPNKKINLLRPPYGAINARAAQVTKQNGLSNILWSIDTRDWADRNSEIVCNRATTSARPGGIILMHDIHETSVNAMECVLNNLSKNGYNFVTISKLFDHKLEPGKIYFNN